ncbi:MAG: acetate--CoA ligase family protein [Burkholderiales bacterium]|nr:acetate--CoA ligase family protein [Burkholderiales bacterium]
MNRNRPRPDLTRLFDPCAVAVVGASEDERRIGGEPVRYLATLGYRGGIYPVNPGRAAIRGLKCYPDLDAIPKPCDVAVIAVSAAAVPDLIRQCARNGIGFAVVLSAGFREAGGEGMALEHELALAAEQSAVRLIGPNCQGFLNLHRHVHCGFGSGFQYPDLRPGPIALVTQSGGFGATMLVRAQDAGLGIGYFVSTGNAVDLGILDLLEYFIERDDVEVLATFIEGITDGRRLRALGARALELRKPILVCKAGNSAAGRRAAASHTASLSAPYALYRAAFDEGGFVEIGDADDLVDAGRAFLGRRLPRGNRVVIVTGSGGAGVIAADRCEQYGLELAPLAEPTLGRLREVLPGFAAASNPVDISGQRSQSGHSVSNAALEIVLDDPAACQVIVRSKQSTHRPENARELVRIAQACGKPVLVALGADRDIEATRVLDAGRVPWHGTTVRAAFAAQALAQFSRKLERSRSAQPASRPLPRRDLPLASRSGTLSEHESKAQLRAYGIPIAVEAVVSLDEVPALKALPSGLAYPVVVKIDSADIAHKTEADAVVLDVRDNAALAEAARRVVARARCYRPAARLNGVTIAAMASGIELIVGVVDDACFGPVVALGSGGVAAEILRDVTHGFAPLGAATAREMIGRLRCAPLLSGYRGAPAHDVEALADALVRISWLAADHVGRIAEIDVNPLFVRPAGRGVLAADALVVLRAPSHDAPAAL